MPTTPFRVRHGIVVEGVANTSPIVANNQVLTGSANTPLIDLSTVWNTTSNVSAIKLNVTNTNSGLFSNFLNFQIAGSNYLRIDRTGNIYIKEDAGSYEGMTLTQAYDTTYFGATTGSFRRFVFGTCLAVGLSNINVQLRADSLFGWSSTTNVLGTSDLVFGKDAANTFAQRNGTAGQTYRLYGTYTDSSNYERIRLSANTTAHYIIGEEGGTGLARPLYLGTNNATWMTISELGNVGIGTASPTSTLHVNGTANITSTLVQNTSPGIIINQTWNNSSNTFTGLQMNVTDTASTASSLLMDLQVGGTSVIQIDKSGWVGVTNSRGICQYGNVAFNINLNQDGTIRLNDAGGGIRTATGLLLLGGTDLVLRRRGAANLALGAADGAAPIAQTLSVQSVVAGTLNTAGANWTFTGSQGTGTGAGGSIIFQVAPAGSSGTAQNALVTGLRIDNTIHPNGGLGITSTGGNNLLLYYFGNGGIFFGDTYGNNFGGFQTGGHFRIGTDVNLFRDAANTLALRNGTNAQQFNIYRSYTSASVHNKLSLRSTGVFWMIETSDNGTSGGDPMAVGSGYNGFPNSSLVLFGAPIYFRSKSASTDTVWSMSLTGHFVAGADNTYDIGSSASALRPRNIYVGTSLTLGDAANIVAQTTTGTKIGTATTQKLGFWNAAPIVQPTTAVAAATVASTGIGDVVAATTTFDGYTIPQIVKALRDAGLLA